LGTGPLVFERFDQERPARIPSTKPMTKLNCAMATIPEGNETCGEHLYREHYGDGS
jgi:hypothetical protein